MSYALFIRRTSPDQTDWQAMVGYMETDPAKTLIGLYDTRDDAERELRKLRIPYNVQVEVRPYTDRKGGQ